MTLWCVFAGKKSTSSFTPFLRYCKRYWELVILGNLAMPDQAHSKCWYKHVENFNVYLLGKKSTSSTFFFLKIMSRLCQLAIVEFRIRWDVICNKSDSVILEKQPSELARNCRHYSQTSYKTWGCNLWISHEEKVIMWNLHMQNLLIWGMSIPCLQVSEE